MERRAAASARNRASAEKKKDSRDEKTRKTPSPRRTRPTRSSPLNKSAIRVRQSRFSRVVLAAVGFFGFILVVQRNTIPSYNTFRGSLAAAAPFKAKPRVLGYYFRDETTESFVGVQRLDPNLQRRLTHPVLDETAKSLKAQMHLTNSKDYDNGMRDDMEEDDCVAQYEWQKTSFPSCNLLYELDLTNLHATSRHDAPVWLVGNGYWRDVWIVKDTLGLNYAFKTMRYEHAYQDRNYDRHRRDAVAMERLTGSPNIIDIYGFCGNSGIFEFADGGDIEVMVFETNKDAPKWNSTERLIVSHQVAAGLSDVHNFVKPGVPAIVHSDITTSQFVHVNGRYKLNDFNRCRFLAHHKNTDETCGFYVGNNPGHFRAPEEYKYDLETEKIDVYSLGNVFYAILIGLWPFENSSEKEAQQKIMNGERPDIPKEIKHSKDPADQAILKAMEMCWIHDPKQRASSQRVFSLLRDELVKMKILPEED